MDVSGALSGRVPVVDATSVPETEPRDRVELQVVCYDPHVADPWGLKRVEHFVEDRTSLFLKRSLEADRQAVQHWRQRGEGRIFVLLGHSTAGKTSIIKELRKEHPEWIESGMDMYFPMMEVAYLREQAPELYQRIALAIEPADIGRALGDVVSWKSAVPKAVQEDALAALEEAKKIVFDHPSRDANMVNQREPELYAKMALGLEHRDIAYALFGNEPPRWKPGITAEVQKEAQAALEEAKSKGRAIPMVEEEYERIMEEEVIEQAMGGGSVIFDPYDEEAFLARMIEKNNYVPLKMGLAYCPFPDLADRVAQRNRKALATGNLDDYRNPLAPLQQFCDFYRPAKDGETVLDTLHRAEVERIFEEAFQQQTDYFLSEARKQPPHPPLLPTADERYSRLMQEHDSLKMDMLTKLGFTDPGVTEVKITPSRKSIDYLFRTNVMQPADSARVIVEWK